MKFAYADPPYMGQSDLYRKEAKADGRVASEVDHAELIIRLVDEFPDGWALSASTPSLRYLLPLCPDRIRVMAWVKQMATWRKGISPSYAWEPVLLCVGRKPPVFIPDWHKAVRIDRYRQTHGVIGAKPLSFCVWVLRCLGFEPGDEIVDLFPGTGVMAMAAEVLNNQRVLPLVEQAV